jgi:entericidin B
MKRISIALGTLLISIGLVGCNTMRGMGQDVERGGEKMQSGASNAQKGRSGSDKSDRSNKSAAPSNTTPSNAPPESAPTYTPSR